MNEKLKSLKNELAIGLERKIIKDVTSLIKEQTHELINDFDGWSRDELEDYVFGEGDVVESYLEIDIGLSRQEREYCINLLGLRDQQHDMVSEVLEILEVRDE